MAGDRLHFKVDACDAGGRADKLVTKWLAETGHPTPRAEVQRWMAEGKVVADGQPVRKSALLSAGATIEVELGTPQLSEAEPDPSVRFEVRYEDEHLLVIEKPAGLVVHPARGHRTGTLVNGLLALGGFDAENADPRDPEGKVRPGIVHRLDKDTSGLMVVAKTPRCREGLKALLASHSVERQYLALVIGRARAASYDTPHGRHPTSRLRFTSKLPADRPGTKRARTDVQVARILAGCTLVRCTLHTGRTHQVRVHLAEQGGTPILADALYGRPPQQPWLGSVAQQLGRQALHAAILGFEHPITAEKCRWESPLPDDMQRALDRCEAHRQ